MAPWGTFPMDRFGTFFIENTSIRIEIYHFIFKEILMMKLLKRTHPGTIVSLILIATIACLILMFFFF